MYIISIYILLCVFLCVHQRTHCHHINRRLSLHIVRLHLDSSVDIQPYIQPSISTLQLGSVSPGAGFVVYNIPVLLQYQTCCQKQFLTTQTYARHGNLSSHWGEISSRLKYVFLRVSFALAATRVPFKRRLRQPRLPCC